MANLRENVYLLSMLPTKKQHRCGALYRTLLSLSPLIVFIYLNTAIYCNKIALKHNCQQYECLLYLRLASVFKQYFLTLLHFFTSLCHAMLYRFECCIFAIIYCIHLFNGLTHLFRIA